MRKVHTNLRRILVGLVTAAMMMTNMPVSAYAAETVGQTNVLTADSESETNDDAIASGSQNEDKQETDPAGDKNTDESVFEPADGASEEVKEPSEDSVGVSEEETDEETQDEELDEEPDEELEEELDEEVLDEELIEEKLPVVEEIESEKLLGASGDYVFFNGSIGSEENERYFAYKTINGKMVCVLDNAGGFSSLYGHAFETNSRAGLYYDGDLILIIRGTTDFTMRNPASGAPNNSYGIYVTGKLTLLASGTATLKARGSLVSNTSCGIYADTIEMPYSSPVSGTFEFPDYTGTASVDLGSCSARGLTVNVSTDGGGYRSWPIAFAGVKSSTNTVAAGKLNATASEGSAYGIYSNTSNLTVSGGTVTTTNGQIKVRNMTVSGGTVKADWSGVETTEGNAIEVDTFTVTNGSVEARSPKSNKNKASGINCNTLKISGGSIYAYGTMTTDGGGGVWPYVQGIYTMSINMTGGSIVANAGSVGGASLQGAGIRFSDSPGTMTFSGGTIEAYGGSINSGNTSGKSYGICGGGAMVLSGTKLTARGYTNAFGKNGDSLDAGCIVAGTGTSSSGIKPLGWGAHTYSELSSYKYLIAGTEAQMKAINSSYVPQDRSIEGAKITLTGGTAYGSTANRFRYNGSTNALTATVTLAGVDITDKVTFSGTQLSSGKPAYTEPGTYTVTATAKFGSKYTGSVSSTYTVSGMSLSSLTVTVSSGDPYTYDGTTTYSTIKLKVTGKGSADGRTYTLGESDYTKEFGYLVTNPTSTAVGTVDVTVKTKSGGRYEYLMSGATGIARTSFTVNKAAPTMTLSRSSVDAFTGNTVDLSKYVQNAKGTVSYAIATSLAGCTISGSSLKCGSTAGTCMVTVTDAGNTYYRSGSKTITINVANKTSNNLTVTMEDVKKTDQRVFVGMTSGVSGQYIPDPEYTKVSGAVDIVTTYSGTMYNGDIYKPTQSKPTKPGKYMVTVSYHTDSDDYSGSADFYIKGDLSSGFIRTCYVWESNSYHAIYDGSEVAVEIQTCASVDGYLTEGTHYKFKSGQKATDAGTYTAVIEPASEYYTGERSVTWAIGKKNPQIDDFVLPELSDHNYDGTSRKIATPKLADGLTGCGDLSVYYTDGYGNRVDDVINAGYYNVHLNVPGGKNFNADDLNIGNFTISKVADPAAINETATVVCDGNTVDLSKNVTGNVGAVTFEHDGTDTGCTVDSNTGLFTSGAEPTVASVRVRIAETTNHYGYDNGFITVTVTEKAKKPLTVKQSDGTYGSTLADPVYTKPSGTQRVDVFYTGYDNIGNFYDSVLRPAEAGNYTVHVSCEAKSEIFEGTADFRIAPKDISKAVITLDSAEVEYNAYEKTVGISSVILDSVSLYNGPDYMIESGFSEVDAGEYNLVISGCGNYTGKASAAWKILKLEPARHCFGDYFIEDCYYDGTPKTVRAPELESPYTGCGEFTLYYVSENYKKSTEAPTECGDYKVLLDVAEGSNFKAATGIEYANIRILKASHENASIAISVASGGETTYDCSRFIEPGGSIISHYMSYGGEYISSYEIEGNKIRINFLAGLHEGNSTDFQITIGGCTNYEDYTLTLTTVVSHDHQLEKVSEKTATCEEDGHIEYYTCKIEGCDQLFKDAEGKEPLASLDETIIPALGHDWGEWKVTKKPTDTTPGEKTRTCKRCKHSGKEELPPVVTPGKVVIDTDGADTVYTGETLKLSATVIATVEGKETSQEVIWTSSNARVAQVSEEGLVTGIANGSVTITAASVEKPSVKATVKLLVRTKITDLKLVLPTANLPDDTNTNMGRLQTGKSMTASAVFNDGVDKADRGLIWYSEDSTVAAVNQKGVITAKAPSDDPIMITAVSTVDETRVATCYVTVYDPVTSIKLNKTALTLGVGETYKGLTVSFAPANASVQDWIFTYPNDGIIADISRVTVDGAECLAVKGGKAGKSKITVKATDGSGKSAVCNVTVGNAVDAITISAAKNKKTLAAGKTLKLTAVFNGGNKSNQPANKDIEWKITSELDSDGNNAPGRIATIDQKGTFKAVAAGTVKVSAVHAQSGKSADYDVRVIVPMTKLAVSESKVTVSESRSYSLSAVVTPKEASLLDEGNLIWKVVKSDPDQEGKPIVDVDTKTGELSIGKLADGKAKATATVKVTARSESEGDKPIEKSAQCVVTVTKEVKVSKVTLSASKISAGVGSRYMLKAAVAPLSADNLEIAWDSSDDESVEVIGDGASATVNVKAVPANKKPVTITATATDGSGKTAKCTVTVGNAVKPGGVAITQTDAQKRLVVGKTTTLKSVVSSGDGKAKPANSSVTWRVSNAWNAEGVLLPENEFETIATVSEKGVVKAVECGRVEITATSAEMLQGGSPAEASVEICTYRPVTKITVSQTKKTIGEGKTGFLWISEATPVNAFDPADPEGRINWTTSGSEQVLIAAYTPGTTPEFAASASTVRGQKLIFKAVGQTKKAVTIKGVTNDGSNKSVKCQVTVLGCVKADDVKLSITKRSVAAALQKLITVEPGYDTAYKELTVTGLSAGKTVKLVPHLTATAADKSVTYRSSNSYIATVSASGVITAKHPGRVVITMTTSDSGKTATCTVVVQ
ncbi:MAG: hypothetical protein E7307_03375 [Butyrivibrio sp.]|nr:hypothetical protein [Butyrivibrio sp.]